MNQLDKGKASTKTSDGLQLQLPELQLPEDSPDHKTFSRYFTETPSRKGWTQFRSPAPYKKVLCLHSGVQGSRMQEDCLGFSACLCIRVGESTVESTVGGEQGVNNGRCEHRGMWLAGAPLLPPLPKLIVSTFEQLKMIWYNRFGLVYLFKLYIQLYRRGAAARWPPWLPSHQNAANAPLVWLHQCWKDGWDWALPMTN